jgi:DNA polymerase-3 subunit chi
MTQVDFYTHVEDRYATACKLCAKALAARVRVLAYMPDAVASERFSRLLWSVPQTSFVAHCPGADRLAAVTPIIVDHRADHLAHEDVLLNLRDDLPSFFSRFNRVIEIVSTTEADRLAARDRFRFYRDRGYHINTHDLSGSAR